MDKRKATDLENQDPIPEVKEPKKARSKYDSPPSDSADSESEEEEEEESEFEEDDLDEDEIEDELENLSEPEVDYNSRRTRSKAVDYKELSKDLETESKDAKKGDDDEDDEGEEFKDKKS